MYLEAPAFYHETYVSTFSTMSNGQTCASLSGDLLAGHFRNDGTKVYRYIHFSIGEWLVYDFSQKIILFRWICSARCTDERPGDNRRAFGVMNRAFTISRNSKRSTNIKSAPYCLLLEPVSY